MMILRKIEFHISILMYYVLNFISTARIVPNKNWDFAIRTIMNYVSPFIREAKAPATKYRGHKTPIRWWSSNPFFSFCNNSQIAIRTSCFNRLSWWNIQFATTRTSATIPSSNVKMWRKLHDCFNVVYLIQTQTFKTLNFLKLNVSFLIFCLDLTKDFDV